jgi:putative membrane protein
MRNLLLRWISSACALWLTSGLFAGIRIDGALPLLAAALMLGILNALVRPVLLLLTLPLTIVTLGLFVFIVNAIILKMAAFLVPGVVVQGFWTAVFGAILLSLFNIILNAFIVDRGDVEYVYIDYRRG